MTHFAYISDPDYDVHFMAAMRPVTCNCYHKLGLRRFSAREVTQQIGPTTYLYLCILLPAARHPHAQLYFQIMKSFVRQGTDSLFSATPHSATRTARQHEVQGDISEGVYDHALDGCPLAPEIGSTVPGCRTSCLERRSGMSHIH